MARNNNRTYNFGTIKITKYATYETGAKALAMRSDGQGGMEVAEVDFSNFARNIQVTLETATGSATTLGDDGQQTSFARQMDSWSFEYAQSPAAAGPLASLGLLQANDSNDITGEYYRIVCTNEKTAGHIQATFDVGIDRLLSVNTAQDMTDVSTDTVSWPIQGLVAITPTT